MNDIVAAAPTSEGQAEVAPHGNVDADRPLGSASTSSASEKRNDAFHALFSGVPETDHLIKDYECILRREIPSQGRLYLSKNYICFHASSFGSVTNFIIPVAEITGLNRKIAAYAVHNAIEICTPAAEYTFASFFSFNAVCDILDSIWRPAYPLTGAGPCANLVSGEGAGNDAAVGNGRRLTQCACSKLGNHFDTVVMDIVLPGTPENIYKLMFTSKFVKEWMANEQKLTEIQISDWYPEQSGSQLLIRNASYLKPLLGSEGSKQTKCELKDETLHIDIDDYISVVTTTRTPEVPSGRLFSVKTRTCIMWADVVASRLIVSTMVEWTGTSYIKPVVDKREIESQRQYYADLEKIIRSYIVISTPLPTGEGEEDEIELIKGQTEPIEGQAAVVANTSASDQPLATPRVLSRNVVSVKFAHQTRETTEQSAYMQSVQEMFQCLMEHGCIDLTPRIDPNQFSSGMVAGGSFGDIWKGKLHEGTDIAVKVWRFTAINEDGSKSIKRAMRELYNWSKVDHDNIHKLLGVVMFQGRLGMVSEWMEAGHLREYIDKNPDVDRHGLCVQVAEGLTYLHHENIVHGDLKACNILVSSNGIPKLTDFDHSIITDCSLRFTETTQLGGGTFRWMAPELVLQSSIDRSKQTDIYALGMADSTYCSLAATGANDNQEITTGTIPYYPECQSDAQVLFKLLQKTPPIRTEHFNKSSREDQTWALLLQCWNHDRTARPTAQRVLDLLRNDTSIPESRVQDNRGDTPHSALLPLLKTVTTIGLGIFLIVSSRLMLALIVARSTKSNAKLAPPINRPPINPSFLFFAVFMMTILGLHECLMTLSRYLSFLALKLSSI